jgi:hypothetical protein
MSDKKPDDPISARSVAIALAAGVGMLATIGSVPLVHAVAGQVTRQVADLLNGQTPAERLAERQAETEGNILRMTTDPAALMAIVAEEVLADRGETFGPSHEELMGQIHEMALDAAIRHADLDVTEIRAIRDQGLRLAESDMTGSQFDAWATEITTFEDRALREIQEVTAELEAAGLGGEDGQSFTFEYTLSPTGYSPVAQKMLFTDPEKTEHLHAAAERLEETVVASIGRIQSGMEGDFSWVQEREVSLALD